MLYRNMFLKYMAPVEGDGTPGEGAPAGTPPTDPVDPVDTAKPTDKEAELLKEVMAKKAAIKDLETKFNGIDVELYNTMLQERETTEQARQAEQATLEQERLKAEGKFDELLQAQSRQNDSKIEQVKTQFQKELDAANTELTNAKELVRSMTSTIEALTIDSSFANSQFIHEELVPAFNPAKTKKLYGEYFDVIDGNVVAFDKPRGAADRTGMVNKDGKPLAFEEAISRLVESDPDADAMKRSKHKDGSGSGTNGQQAQQKQQPIQSGVGRIAAALNAQS